MGLAFGVLFLPLAPDLAAQTGERDPADDPTAGLSRREAGIEDLRLYSDGDRLYADLDLSGAFISEIRDRIEAGLEVEFTYTIELYKKRKWWFNRRLLHARVTTKVRRDSLAGTYELILEMDEEELDRATAEEAWEVEEWMSRLRDIPLIGLSDLPQEDGEDPVRILLRAKAKIRDEFILLFIPWDFETDWEKVVLARDEIPMDEALVGPARTPARAASLPDEEDP